MIRLVYPTEPNFGDAMSPLIVKKLSGQEVHPSGMWNADMMAVGSVFYRGDYFIADTYKASFSRYIKAMSWDLHCVTSRPVIVWGAGFLQYPPFKRPHFMRKFKIFALRGIYTKKILENYGIILPENIVTFGDPGLLFTELFSISATPQYEVGIILHVFDAKNDWGRKLEAAFSNAGIHINLINAMDDPFKVVSEIAKCQKIISSSLHGLIVADSLGIPNFHIGLSTFTYSKEDFELKFRDYYSAFGEDMPAIITGYNVLTDPKKYMQDDYYHKVDTTMLEKIKIALRNVFPVKLK